MRTLLAVVLLLLGACSTHKKLNDPTRPQIDIIQTSNVATAARHMRGGMSVQFSVRVENPSKDEIRLRRVTIESLTEGAYHIAPYSLPFDVAVAAAKHENVQFWAPARTGLSVVGANGPVTLRVVCDFDSLSGDKIHQVVTRVVNRYASPSGN
jgi:hypothetical protein